MAEKHKPVLIFDITQKVLQLQKLSLQEGKFELKIF